MTTSTVISPEVIQTVFQVNESSMNAPKFFLILQNNNMFTYEDRILGVVAFYMFWNLLETLGIVFNQRCDKDKNGKLDFQEFHEMITR